MKAITIEPFDNFIIRTPLIPLEEFTELLKQEFKDERLATALLTNYQKYNFSDALLIASNSLHSSILSNNESSQEINAANANAAFKYFTRASTRATPFGLFASCAIGKLGAMTSLVKDIDVRQAVVLDSGAHVNIAEMLGQKQAWRQASNYFANPSIYQISNNWYYIEYQVVNQEINYVLNSFDRTEYVDKILTLATSGSSYGELCNSILDEEITLADAEEFINGLIDIKLLLSEHFYSAHNWDAQSSRLREILENKLESTDESDSALLGLLKVLDELCRPDKDITHSFATSREAFSRVARQFQLKSDIGQIIQVDAAARFKESTLNAQVLNDIRRALDLLNSLSKPHIFGDIENFEKAFAEKYDQQEMPLMIALNPDYGIGYPLLRNDTRAASNSDAGLDATDLFLHQKIIESIKTDSKIIDLIDSDFQNGRVNWENVPPTFSCLVSIFMDNGEESVILKDVGGRSAANVVTRFGHIDSTIQTYIEEIADYEQSVSNGIEAEIVHLPNTKSGNILRRKVNRKHQISCISIDTMGKSIPLEDLYLKLFDGRLVLFSRKLNAIVNPRLTSAHNVGPGTLPLYRFLHDYQNHKKKVNMSFNFGKLKPLFHYFPRIKCGKVIVSPAMWVLKAHDLKALVACKDPEAQYSQWKAIVYKFELPEVFVYKAGDNLMVVDTRNKISRRVFFSLVKTQSVIELTEYFDLSKSSVVQDADGNHYAHEFIIGFKNPGASSATVNLPKHEKRHIIRRDFHPGSDWVYLKLYSSPKQIDRIIQFIAPMVRSLHEQGIIRNWHFVRFFDPKPHLRLRLHVCENNGDAQIIALVSRHMNEWLNDGRIGEFVVDTYTREIERYGTKNMEAVETIFTCDSFVVCEYLQRQTNRDAQITFMGALVDRILSWVGLDQTQKMEFAERMRDGYYREMQSVPNLKDRLSTYYRTHRKSFNTAMKTEYFVDNEAIPNLSDLLEAYRSANFFTGAIDLDADLLRILSSCIHMMANRMFTDNQRLTELYIYHCLYQSYRGARAAQKSFSDYANSDQ